MVFQIQVFQLFTFKLSTLNSQLSTLHFQLITFHLSLFVLNLIWAFPCRYAMHRVAIGSVHRWLRKLGLSGLLSATTPTPNASKWQVENAEWKINRQKLTVLTIESYNFQNSSILPFLHSLHVERLSRRALPFLHLKPMSGFYKKSIKIELFKEKHVPIRRKNPVLTTETAIDCNFLLIHNYLIINILKVPVL